MNNPDFGFLYDGEGASYYLDVLAAHRARTRSGPDSQSLLASLRRWPEPILYPLVAEAEQQLSEVVASLEQMASRDAIRNGRAWIESNAALAPQIAGSLVKRIRTLPTASHRIHVLYLVHDVLQTQAAKKERIQALVCAFKPYLVWLLRPAYQFALSGQREEEGQRALRLLQLWVERGILAPAEAEEMQTLIVAPELPALPDTAAQMPARVRPALPRPASTPLPGMTPAGVSSGVAPRGPVANRFMPGQAVAGSRGGYGAGPGGTGPGLIPFPFPGRPYQVHLGMHTAEQLPVGVMATMMLHAKRQKKTARLDFVPYMPLERVRTLPPMEPLTTRLMDRVEDFYADLRDDDRSSSSSSSRSRRSRSRSRSSRGSQRSRVSSRSRGDAPVPNPMCAVPPPAVE